MTGACQNTLHNAVGVAQSNATAELPETAVAPAGWIGGISVLLVFYAITICSCMIFAECHETDGIRHSTYRSAVKHILGGQQQQLP
jgi:hypothetical protein